MKRYNQYCFEAIIGMVPVLFLSCFSAMAETAASEASAIIPEDPVAAKLRFSDKTIKYKKQFYLRDYSLGNEYWMDEFHYITSMHESNNYKTDVDRPPKVVVVDVRTGDITDTGYSGRVRCYCEGRLVTEVSRLKKNSDGQVVTEELYYVGKYGEALDEYQSIVTRDKELNTASCQLVPRYKRPQFPDVLFPLKVEHGVIYQIQPKDYPALRLGQDERKRIAFYRTGDPEVPPLHVYWEKPSGERIEIQFNPGEKIFNVDYLPFENAYRININLTTSQPIKSWAPRFERLLYLDGTVKRFGVPRVILDLINTNQAGAGVGYSKKGFSWGVGGIARRSDKKSLEGVYRAVGDELIKASPSGSTGPDGCKLFGHEKRIFSGRNDYYYIDICKEE